MSGHDPDRRIQWFERLRCALALAATIALAACGGGEQIARTGGSGTGIASAGGTVTGFGSVIVDGETWDDRDARVEVEVNPATGFSAAESRLGQRVEIEYATRGTAQRVLLQAEVIGRVSEISAGATPPQFKVAGQTVRINTDADLGPITVFEGVAGVAALQLNDVVEVHGSSRFDTQASRYVIVASRVEKRATLPAGLVRVSGVVEGHSAAQNRFRLGELSVALTPGTVLVPANRALADGQRVVVWSDDPLGGTPSAPTLTADYVRILERGSVSGSERSDIAGVISRFNAGTLSFEIGGIRVNARSAIIVPASQSLADGRYVVATGSFDGNGVLQATQVRIRSRGGNDVEVELKGSITDFVSAADFRVRGVPVDASGASPRPGCPATLANGLYVEVEGRVSASTGRVQAERLRCIDNPAGRVLTVEGTASAVSTVTRSFTLTGATGPTRSVSWTPLTFFEGVTPETLAGASVQVDGYGVGPTLVATKVRRR